MAVHIFYLFLSYFILLGAGAQAGAIYEGIVDPPKDDLAYTLPDLPYGYSDLEPHIDEETLRVHHLGHHKAYTKKMNAAILEWRQASGGSNELARGSIVEILTDINTISKKWRTPINNNGGGYVNHIIYWSTMCKPPNPPPSSVLLALIDDSFGSFDNFKHHFTEKALKLFGSGYVWLCLSGNSTSLTIKTTPNQDSPISKGFYPILVIDIWEHAYYLNYKIKRPKYIEHWWELVCWNEVEKLMEFWLSQSSFSLKKPFSGGMNMKDEL